MKSSMSRRRLRQDDTLEDNTGKMKYSENMWGEVAVGAIGAILGLAAYKSGFARKGVKAFIRKASSPSSKALGSSRALRSWLLDSGEAGSIFRSSLKPSSMITKENFKRLGSVRGRRELYLEAKDNLKKGFSEKTLKSTRKDLDGLDKAIEKKTARLESLADTELFSSISDIQESIKILNKDSTLSSEQISSVKNKMINDLVKDSIQTAKKTKQEMKQKGHRAVTLGDLFELTTDKKGAKRLTYKSNVIKDGEATSTIAKTLREAKFENKYGEMTSLLEHKDIMKLKVDGSLLTDGKNISDLRYFRNSFYDITNILTKDFKIPVIGINPFSIIGLNEVGRRSPRFAALSKATIQSSITGSKEYTKNSMFFSNGSVYSIGEDGYKKIKGNMKVERIRSGATIATREIDALRKMQGTSRIDYHEYTQEDGAFANSLGKLGKFLDFGFDDIDTNTLGELGATELLNPNTWIAKGVSKMKEKGFLRPNKGIKIIDKTDDIVRTEKTYTEMFSNKLDSIIDDTDDIYVALNETYSIKNLYKDISKDKARSKEYANKYVSQFNAGRESLDKVTSKTTGIHFLFDRVNSTLGVGGFGLSVDSLSRPTDILANLALKRALPLYAGYNAVQFGIMLTEGEEDENGNKDNIVKKIAKNLASADLLLRKGMDGIGVSSFFDVVNETLPGFDQIEELPGIRMLKLDQDYEERLDYYQNGYEKIRKNRFWDSGNQAFTGTKVDSYKPNLYRRIMADSEFSDSKWGSRWEYFSNAPFPTPLTLFAPIKHFLTDPYHYDKKHANDRPYPVTSPLFQNIPFVGGFLSSTIGEVLKPTRYTHKHIVDGDGVNVDALSNIPMGNALMFDASGTGTGSFIEGDVSGISAVPIASISAGGGLELTGGLSSTDDIYKGLSSGQKAMSSMTTSTTEVSYADSGFNYGSVKSQNGITYNSAQLYEDAGNFFGLYGFMGTTVTGKPLNDMKVLENSSYAYSASRMWWNSDSGGLGGDMNEITRRFLKKRMHEDNLVNPIPNNMADWLPGSDYFIDFKKGDNMIKIANGELRLPGQAYERLHNISEFDLYKFDASALTSVEDILNSTFNKEYASIKGNQDKKRELLSSLRERDLIVDSGAEISDYDRKITASYDAMIKSDSASGEGMLFVRQVEDINKIDKKTKKQDVAKANYSMYASGIDSAFVQYVDDKGNTSNMEEVKYDSAMIDKYMDNMIEAREKIETGMKNGTLSKSDMYSPIDRLRILADVAPYSNEFRNMQSKVATLDLSDEEREEVNAIKDRAKDVRKPLRTYAYKFKHQGTEKQKKIIDSVLSPNSFTVVGDDTVYRLAGVQLQTQEDPVLKKDMTDLLEEFLYVGSAVTLEFDKNKAQRMKGGAKRVIVHKGGESLQRELLDREFAKESDADSVLDTSIKTNVAQRVVGAMWETFAHADTPFHSKFLRVRSAKEDYERSRVYSKKVANWSNPISDYLVPLLFDRNVGRGMVSGLVMGTTVGSMFGKNVPGKTVGAIIGFSTVAIGKVFTGANEIATNQTWKPKRIKKEQALYDYIDKLKFVKYRKLYHDYSALAKKEGVDVGRIIGASVNQKTKKRNVEGWREDYNTRATKLNSVLKIPFGLQRFLSPKSGQNIFGFLTDEMTHIVGGVRRKLVGSFNEIKTHYNTKEYSKRKDNSKVKKNEDTLKDKLSRYWSLGKEDKSRHKELMSEEMASVRNKRILIPLRDKGILYRDKKAPASEKLQKLIDAKVLIASTSMDTLADKTIHDKVKKVGVVPVYKGQLKHRNIDKGKTIARLDREINKVAKKAGYSRSAAKALEYYKLSESTMYAFDKGDSISDVTSAMPKNDKDYFKEFVNAPDEEKLEILDLVPKYMRRPLQASWGLEVEEKDNLGTYFSKNTLPGETWEGWGEDVDLDIVKTKMAKNEQIEFSDANIWQKDVEEANMYSVGIPELGRKSGLHQSVGKMRRLFGEVGFEDLKYNARLSSNESVNLYLKHDRRSEYAGEIEAKMRSNL